MTKLYSHHVMVAVNLRSRLASPASDVEEGRKALEAI